jgi:hypothetical protein
MRPALRFAPPAEENMDVRDLVGLKLFGQRSGKRKSGIAGIHESERLAQLAVGQHEGQFHENTIMVEKEMSRSSAGGSSLCPRTDGKTRVREHDNQDQKNA